MDNLLRLKKKKKNLEFRLKNRKKNSEAYLDILEEIRVTEEKIRILEHQSEINNELKSVFSD